MFFYLFLALRIPIHIALTVLSSLETTVQPFSKKCFLLFHFCVIFSFLYLSLKTALCLLVNTIFFLLLLLKSVLFLFFHSRLSCFSYFHSRAFLFLFISPKTVVFLIINSKLYGIIPISFAQDGLIPTTSPQLILILLFSSRWSYSCYFHWRWSHQNNFHSRLSYYKLPLKMYYLVTFTKDGSVSATSTQYGLIPINFYSRWSYSNNFHFGLLPLNMYCLIPAALTQDVLLPVDFDQKHHI
jgi:hypothetical protein